MNEQDEDPPQFSTDWWWQPFKNDDQPLVPGLSFSSLVLVIGVFLWSFAAPERDHLRPADVLIAGFLALILWRLGDLYFLMRNRMR